MAALLVAAAAAAPVAVAVAAGPWLGLHELVELVTWHHLVWRRGRRAVPWPGFVWLCYSAPALAGPGPIHPPVVAVAAPPPAAERALPAAAAAVVVVVAAAAVAAAPGLVPRQQLAVPIARQPFVAVAALVPPAEGSAVVVAVAVAEHVG